MAPLGDIDVLVADPIRKRLWAIECKDLSGALSTAEVAREMTEHFREVGNTSVSKHSERVEWLAARPELALAELGFDDASGWQLSGLIVTDRPAIAPFIDDVPFEVVAVDDLEDFLTSV